MLATVFIRFCEDNGLIEYPFIAGPGERTAQARERQQAFYEKHPGSDDYGWMVEAIEALSVSPVTAGLFDRKHNPMWTIKPTPFAIKELLAFWRTTDADGEIVYSFTNDEWNTRFLGDLYQDLSESARKTYALLQTPEFVEEFILKYTLDPAIEEFGLEPDPPYGHDDLPRRLRVIDPACGSGHFLLGAFRRLLKAWQAEHPGADRRVLVANALESVHGVDKNPFAAAIARFRLLLAAMKAADVKRLDEQVDFPLNIAIGDSLLHGRGAPGTAAAFGHTYKTEDVDDFLKPPIRILSAGSYHVVVGNPPYITVKDKSENKNYRAYKSCFGTYALSVPFAERMFQLAIRGAYADAGAGYVGQITANSFMKNTFGKKLIEEYLPNVDITHVIDTSGAFLPGFGTPTVVLFGRRRFGRSDSSIRAALGIRGEPGVSSDPMRGVVWKAIVDQLDRPGSSSQWVSVADIDRSRLAKFPWSLGGGGESTIMELLSAADHILAKDIERPIGRAVRLGSEDAFVRPRKVPSVPGVPLDQLIMLVDGEVVREWRLLAMGWVWYPYINGRAQSNFIKELWPYRASLAARRTFQGVMEDAGRMWWEYMQHTASAYSTPLSITFSNVSTHNHFVLDRGVAVQQASEACRGTGEIARLSG